MPDIVFGDDGRTTFPTKYHGEVSLSWGKWNTICDHQERRHYRLNGEKVSTTLINPDIVRHHKHFDFQFLYYKHFTNYEVAEENALPMFMTVVIDKNTKKICTVYPTPRPKPGKEFKPEGSV